MHWKLLVPAFLWECFILLLVFPLGFHLYSQFFKIFPCLTVSVFLVRFWISLAWTRKGVSLMRRYGRVYFSRL